MNKSELKEKIAEKLEEVFPGQVTRDPDGATMRLAIGKGHNSGEDVPLPLGNTESRRGVDDRLRLLIERVERLEEEKKGIAEDVKDVFAEIKAVGYDAKIVRQILKLRKMKPNDRAEMEALLDTYRSALGMD